MAIAGEPRVAPVPDLSTRLATIFSNMMVSRRWWFLATRVIGFTAIVLEAALGITRTLQWLNPPADYDRDFVQLYVMARSFAGGRDLYRPIRAAGASFGVPTTAFPYPAPHPPTLGLILSPLASLNYAAAELCWLGVQIGCLLLALFLVGRRFRWRVSPLTMLEILLLCLAWRPVQADLQWGNVNLVLLAALSGAWLFIHQGRRGWAGCLIGLSLLFKPVAWPILLGLALRRDARAVGAAAGVGTVGLFVTGLLVGFDQPVAYVTRVMPAVTTLYATSAGNISLASVAWRALKGATTGELDGQHQLVSLPFPAPALAAPILAIALPVVACAIGLYFARRWASAEWSFVLLTVLCVVVSPIAWDLYEMLLIIPIVYTADWLYHHRFPARATLAFGFNLAVLAVPWGLWVSLMYVLAGRSTVSAVAPVPALPGLLLSVPTVAVCAVAAFVIYVGGQPAPNGAGSA